MKKIVFIVLAVTLFALMSGSVLAAETPHGPFDDDTDLCAACHRAHTAQASYLIAEPTVTGLCVTCHTSGQGADTDVVYGSYVSQGTWASAGGTSLENLTAINDVAGYAASPGAPLAITVDDGSIFNVGDEITLSIDEPAQEETQPITVVAGNIVTVAETTNTHDDNDVVGNATLSSPDHVDWGNPSNDLLGGGFLKIGGSGGTDTTSKHFNTSTRALTYGVTFGSGTAPGGEIANQASGYMDCVDCHMPHRSSNYRMLRMQPNAAATAIDVGFNMNYGVGESHLYTSENLFNLAEPGGGNEGVSEWCGACHDYYFSNASTGDNVGAARSDPVNTDGAGTYYDIDGDGDDVIDMLYMHGIDVDLSYLPRNGSLAAPIDMSANLTEAGHMYEDTLPVADANDDTAYDDSDILTCLTCHIAHGTTADTTGSETYIGGRTLGGTTNPDDVTFTNDTNLLRIDERATCELCHNMPQGF